MIQQDFAVKLLQSYSLVTVGDDKKPNFTWSINQEEKLTESEFLKRYTYKGGIIKKDGTELTPTKNIGLITGFNDLECIDIDLKVFSTNSEKEEFWNEYLEILKENIYDFDNKIVVYKTLNGGYHLIYKSKRVTGNKKIAKLKGHTEALIETRGKGGYIFVYPENKIGKLTYFDVQYITDAEREIIWNISSAYNHEEKKEEVQSKEVKKIFESGNLKPWDDFNNQTNIWDVINEDFTIPTNGHKKKFTLIKRNGAKSTHSGYIYLDSNCMYLHSTGTIYPHETLISPSFAYAIKYHNSDFSASAKDLYEQGFGDRVQYKELEKAIIPKIKNEINEMDFPIDVFPDLIQTYIQDCKDKLQMNVDYMGCSLLWLISLITGNSYDVEVKKGWKEKAVIWLALVGNAGIGKTPSINKISFPINKINLKNQKKYHEAKTEFEEFNKLSKKEKQELFGTNYQMKEPVNTQMIVNDITLEALIDLHQNNENSIGVLKDELAGWLKDMNKYRAGSDLEFWLSSWSGQSVSVNRMTRKGGFVEYPFISVLGGIQPSIFDNLTTEENKENGFMDRLLISYPDVKVDKYIDAEMSYEAIKWYEEIITKFYNDVKRKFESTKEDERTFTVKFSTSAKDEWVRIFNDITDKQNSDNENQYLKSMYPKQKSYVPRFALLIHLFECFFNDWINIDVISKESMLKAEKLSAYFVNNAKKVKIESNETKEIKSAIKDKKTNFEKLKEIYDTDSNFNRSKVADLLGVSRVTINTYLKQLEK
mgnify:CR=1 FL=1|tara:strand:- start:1540 stop:3828 length:2289 start_codon:yes stop_codon:yes gene_type:complete